MANDIAQWLDSHGLGQYLQAFTDNDIDLRALPYLSEDDLKELGLSLGHRRIFQAALKEPADISRAANTKRGPDREHSEPRTTAEAERRHLTVLFCDLVGSTALSAELDPEDMRDILRAYQDACARVIARYGGFVAKYMGDGVYAYFGYPIAHENDAERAINAGLGIAEAVPILNPREKEDQKLAVRIGIATGNVAVGDLIGEGPAEEANVVGSAPNLAARLQAIAEPGTMVISEATRALAGNLFETEALAERELKGFSDPIRAWIVLRTRATESRFEATRGAQLSELVGRDEELEILHRRWHRATEGEGQIVLISGEAGIGKSRLAHALQDDISGQPHTRLRYQCLPHHTTSALYPVIERLERSAAMDVGDSADTKFAKLQSALKKSGMPTDEAAPVFTLLSIPAQDRYPPLAVSPQRLKELTLDALVEEVVGLARQEPVLFIFEDAHWIDPTTLEFLEMIAGRVPQTSILMIVTYRPEFVAPWIGRQRVTPMILGRLEKRDCALIVESVSRGHGIDERLRERIVSQTDGVPLFVEELTNAVANDTMGNTSGEALDSHPEALHVNIPSTLHDSLTARIDGLGSAKELAQVAACIGRYFSRQLLAAVAAVTEDELDRGLSKLVASGLFYPERQRDGSGFAFKHFLVQQAAYAGLLRTTRRKIHSDIAAALIARHDQNEGADLFSIARHLQAADRIAESLPWFRKSAERAANSGSVREAMEILSRALDLVDKLPLPENQCEGAELDLLVTKLPISIAITGWASDDAKLTSSRALELAMSLGDKMMESDILFQIATMHEVRGEYSETQEVLARRYRIMEQEAPSPEPVVESGELMACSTFYQGRFDTSIEYATRALEYADPRKQTVLGSTLSEDPTIASLFWIAKSLLLQGRIDKARLRFSEAFDCARQSSHWYAQSQAEVDAALLCSFQRDYALAIENAEKAIESSSRVGLVYREAVASLIREWGLAQGYGHQPDLRKLDSSLDVFRQAGAMIGSGFYLALASETYARTGAYDHSEELIDEAFRSCEQNRGFFYKSELYRLKGTHALQHLGRDAAAVAENSYRRGLGIARSQGARLFELRIANSLARLMIEQGEPESAGSLLGPIHGWFQEGADIPDLEEAKTLLDSLV